jgi:hypothetical protein
MNWARLAQKESIPMAQPLRPETIELLASFAEKAGLLAATVMRERPQEARALAFGLFETVMLSFSHAVDNGTDQLRDSRAYYAFECAWRPALKHAMADLLPPATPDDPDTMADLLPPATPDDPDTMADLLPPATPGDPDKQ